MMRRLYSAVLVSVLCMLLSGCGSNPNEEIHGFERWDLVDPEYMEAEDGTFISQWTNSDGLEKRFQLPDGEELLQVSVIQTLVAEEEKKGLTGITAMSAEARKTVEDYYEIQGEMFDLDETLLNAWVDYKKCADNKERFIPHVIAQEVMPVAQNDYYVAFLTAVTCPKDEHYTGNTRCIYDSVIFDIQDGHEIDIKSLFQVNWDEAKDELAGLCNKEDTTVSKEDILEVMDQAEILIFQDYLEVWFPYGTWERQEFDKGFGLKYDKVIHLLEDWAIPSNVKVT